MNKLLFTILILFSIQVPTPAQAGVWQTLRNSWIATKIWGKPAASQLPVIMGAPNYTGETRLPVEHVRPWWHNRWFNFYSWMNFRNAAQEVIPQPEPTHSQEVIAPAPAQQEVIAPAPIPEEIAQPLISQEAAQRLFARLDKNRKERADKKNKELQALKARRAQKEEKQKQEVIKSVNNFEHQMTAIAGRFDAFNNQLDRINGKLENNQRRLELVHQRVPKVSQLAPQLPVMVVSPQSEVDETLERIEQRLAHFERQRLSPDAPSSPQSAELIQSAVPVSNPALNTSVTSRLVESFTELPLTPSSSPELLANGQAERSGSIFHHIQVDPQHYSTKASKGRDYLQQISQGKLSAQLAQKTQDEHMEVIETIVYRLHQSAAYKGEGFLEGTYVIQDTENFDLWNTLLSFVKKVNPEVTGTITDPLAHVSFNPFAYARDASHYVHNKDKYRYYGIDMRRSDKTSFTLPGDHAHLLIGFVDFQKRLIFLKPEHKGIYILDGWLGHSYEFISAQTRKNTWFGRSARAVAGYFGYKIFTDDDQLYHKERIPAEFLQQFGLLLAQEEALTGEQKKQLSDSAKKLGIQTLTDAQIAGLGGFQYMKEAYLKQYGNIENRSGREIHRTLPELLTLEQ